MITLAIIVLVVTANQALGTYAFWGGMFLGILAVLKRMDGAVMVMMCASFQSCVIWLIGLWVGTC